MTEIREASCLVSFIDDGEMVIDGDDGSDDDDDDSSSNSS